MDKQDAHDLAGRIKALFEEKFGEFRQKDFEAIAKELGFVLTYIPRTNRKKKLNTPTTPRSNPGKALGPPRQEPGILQRGWSGCRRSDFVGKRV